jgi:hypothetical protein
MIMMQMNRNLGGSNIDDNGDDDKADVEDE